MVPGALGRATLVISLGLALPSAATGGHFRTTSGGKAVPRTVSSTKLFVVVYRPGPAWRPDVPMAGQALLDHLRYYRSAASEGRVFAGGAVPSVDGGLAILTMENLEEAQAFLAADPAILGGVFTGEVNLWAPAVRSNRPLP